MSSRTPDTPAARVAHARRSLTDRLVLAGFDALTRVLLRLPDRQLHRAAQVAGAGLYLAWPTRRALVRSNLERVSRSLTARGMASPRIAHAARDPRALDALVRSAFGHYLRSYLEVALAPGITRRYLDERISVETPATARQAFAEDGDANGQGRIFVALHLGSIELPGFYAVVHGGRPITAPMETLRDPAIQDYLERSRSASGVRIVPVRGSGRVLAEALARGESVALVADRVVAGSGRPVSLFGAPARLPVGPALLAIESGAPVFVAALRRTGYGTYAARIVRLESPGEGTRRERVATLMARQARLFESLIADAPDQWWTVFFPIWPAELERRATHGSTRSAAAASDADADAGSTLAAAASPARAAAP